MQNWRQNRTLFVFILLSALPLAILLYRSILSPSPHLKFLPNPNLTNIDTHVAEKIAILRQQVEQNLDSAELWGELGMILDVHDFKREAIACYERAGKMDLVEFRWPYYQAITLNLLGSSQALDLFARSLSLNPQYAPANIRFAQALFDAGDLEKAEESYRYTLAIDENSPYAFFGLAKISLNLGNLSNSRQLVQKAIDLSPKYREAHGVLAEILRRLGQVQAAEKELQIARELPKIKRLEDPIYEELIAKGMTPFWFGERARIYEQKGLFEKAAQEIEIGLRLSPNPKGYNHLGNLLKHAGRFEEAVKHYRKAAVLDPNYFEVTFNLAQLLFDSSKFEDALFWAERARRLNPKSPQSYTLLGKTYLRLNRESEAIQTFQQGLQYTPGSITLARVLAWLLATSPIEELRDGAQALMLAETLVKKTNYQDPEVLDVLAAAYAESGMFDRALKWARKAHELAMAKKNLDLTKQIKSRIDLYLGNKPYRHWKE